MFRKLEYLALPLASWQNEGCSKGNYRGSCGDSWEGSAGAGNVDVGVGDGLVRVLAMLQYKHHLHSYTELLIGINKLQVIPRNLIGKPRNFFGLMEKNGPGQALNQIYSFLTA